MSSSDLVNLRIARVIKSQLDMQDKRSHPPKEKIRIRSDCSNLDEDPSIIMQSSSFLAAQQDQTDQRD